MNEKAGDVLRRIERLKRKPIRLRETNITMAQVLAGRLPTT